VHIHGENSFGSALPVVESGMWRGRLFETAAGVLLCYQNGEKRQGDGPQAGVVLSTFSPFFIVPPLRPT